MMEGTLTQPEQLLNDSEHKTLAKQVREAIDRLIKPQIESSIEEVMNVKVVDFLCDTTIDTSRTGAIAILGLKPKDPPPKNSDRSIDETIELRSNVG